jgi:hypothetical protein
LTITSRPVNPRASRIALIVASVPEFTSRTFSMLGTAAMISSASSLSASVGAPKLVPRRIELSKAATTRGWACPRIIGPQEPM